MRATPRGGTHLFSYPEPEFLSSKRPRGRLPPTPRQSRTPAESGRSGPQSPARRGGGPPAAGGLPLGRPASADGPEERGLEA